MQIKWSLFIFQQALLAIANLKKKLNIFLLLLYLNIEVINEILESFI